MPVSAHPDTSPFVSALVREVLDGAPNLLVVCRDEPDLTLIRNLANGLMEMLNLRPRLKTLNLIGWKGSSIRFEQARNLHGHDLQGASVFVTPHCADNLPPELERALTGDDAPGAPAEISEPDTAIVG